jgi:hypothetical protein
MYIDVTDYVDRCKEFAAKCAPTVLANYRKRNQINPQKIELDIYNGKIAEYAVYEYLRLSSIDCTEPDTKIYLGRSKNFNADLCTHSFDIHVKSQSEESARLYGKSALFQKTDKLITAPSQRDLLCFVETRPDRCVIIGFIQAVNMRYELPKIPQIAFTKVAAYIESLKDHLFFL